MEGVLYIYIFLIIISVLFIIYYFKNKKTILDETNEHFKFKNCNKNNKLNIYTKDYLHNKFSSEPNLNIENGSQFNLKDYLINYN